MRFIVHLICCLLCAASCLVMLSCENVSSKEHADNKDVQLLRDNLKLTEIHYHPFDSFEISGADFEFIELKNVGASELDLSGIGFTDGIDYTFPSGATVKPGAFIVLASNGIRFAQRYGFDAFDTYVGTQLSNGGEEIEISDMSSGSVIIYMEYDDEAPWPLEADGLGYSLVSCDINPTGDPADAGYWCVSADHHGSPGKDDTQ